MKIISFLTGSFFFPCDLFPSFSLFFPSHLFSSPPFSLPSVTLLLYLTKIYVGNINMLQNNPSQCLTYWAKYDRLTQLHFSTFCQKNILSFDVSVNNVILMQMADSLTSGKEKLLMRKLRQNNIIWIMYEHKLTFKTSWQMYEIHSSFRGLFLEATEVKETAYWVSQTHTLSLTINWGSYYSSKRVEVG